MSPTRKKARTDAYNLRSRVPLEVSSTYSLCTISNSVAHLTKQPKKEQPPTFLSLPAELRDEIYSLALTEDQPISVTPTLKQPSLLLVNQQIRSEAKALWYPNNTFQITIVDFNFHDIYMKFALHASQMAVQLRVKPPRRGIHACADFMGGPNWASSLSWCRHIHSSRLAPDTTEQPTGLGKTLRAALILAYEFVEMEWESVERALIALRPVFGELDAAWWDD